MRSLPKALLLAGVIVFGAVAVRALLDRPYAFDYAAFVRDNPERLFPAGYHATYDIHGLYEGAATTAVNISERRFIAPEPAADMPRILFLGGSTTEALYVPERERWVALLGGFNAGTSGSNTLDRVSTLRYLNGRGDQFERIVIMTAHNDAAAVVHLGERYAPDAYTEAITAWLTANPAPQADTVLAAWQAQAREGAAMLADCAGYSDFLTLYSERVVAHLQLLKDAAGDTPILALSEPSSYNAPADSFLHDLRIAFPCDGQDLSYAESAKLMRDVNERYLAAADALSLQTFDLAGAVNPYTNGSEGGRYLYDSVHMTPLGNRLVADTLSPLLEQSTSSEA